MAVFHRRRGRGGALSGAGLLSKGGIFGAPAAVPSWLVPGPDGALPIQVSAWAANAGYVNGQVYGSAAAYLAAAGGTFSRASDAWVRDANKLWRKSGSNALRLHHDAVGKPLGLLIEGQRTFSLLYSRDLTNAAWTKRGACTVTPDMAVARPDGTPGAMRIAGLGASGSDDIYQTRSGGPTSQPYAPSFMLRRITTTGVMACVASGGSGRWDVDLALLPDEWVRITRGHPAVTVVTEFATSAGGAYGLQFYAVSGGPLTVYLDFVNVEFASGALWPSSPMDPSTGAATRLADNLSYPATASSEMTVVIDAITPPGWAGSHTLFHWSDGTANNRLRLYRDASTSKLSLLSVIAGASAWYALSDDVISSGSRLQVALSLKAGAIAALVEGSAAKTYAPASPIPPGLTTIVECSSGAAEYWFGTEARLTRYAKAYAAADLPGLLS